MHSTLLFLGCWLFAFVTLAGALILLNIYSDIIGYDFILHGRGKEVSLAAFCSLLEGGNVWFVASYFPTASRALFLPILLVAVIYALAHLEDWNRFDAGLVLLFQFALAGVLGSLIAGYFSAALLIAAGFAAVLVIVASIAKGL